MGIFGEIKEELVDGVWRKFIYCEDVSNTRKPSVPQLSSESLAQRFHEKYERLAPCYGYKTRKQTSVQWKDVPDNNKKLMIHVCAEILREGI